MCQKNISSENGDFLWIDIFPFDVVPVSNRKQVKFYKNAHVLRLMLESAMFKQEIAINSLSEKVKKLMCPIFKKVGAPQIGLKLSKYAQKYCSNDSGYIGGVVWGYGCVETLPQNSFGRNIRMPFEGIDVNVLDNWEYYLTNVYGNYMELPSEDKRMSHEILAFKI